MESKPSFWLFYSSINRKTMLGEPLRVYDKRKKETTVYDDSLYIYKGTIKLLSFLITFFPATMLLQLDSIITPLGLMKNMVFELILLELIIVIVIYFAVLYYKVYLKFNFTVIEKIKEKKIKAMGIINVILLILLFLFLVLNSFSVCYLRSLVDERRDNIENIEVLVDFDDKRLLFGDDVWVGYTSSSYKTKDGFVLIQLDISRTPLPVSAYINDVELEVVKDKDNLNFFWEGNLFFRRYLVYLPEDQLENYGTFRVVCGGIDKSLTVRPRSYFPEQILPKEEY